MIQTCKTRPHARIRQRCLAAASPLALALALCGTPVQAQSISAQALPQGPAVIAGSAVIRQTGSSALAITTGGERTAIDWSSFSIGSAALVSINQPNAAAITVNQVVGASPSAIFGALTSNGRVVLTNRAGIWFGPSAHVDVAGLVASTAGASAGAIQAFAAGGALHLDTPGHADASVVNDGRISVAQSGLAALVAPGVANNGWISANLGTVDLASGRTAVVDFYGDGLINFAVDGAITAAPRGPTGRVLQDAVSNSGGIMASGGRIIMTAAAVAGVVDQAINLSGVASVRSARRDGGAIVLDGGDGNVTVSGTLDASSGAGAGGTITLRSDALTRLSGDLEATGGTHGGSIETSGLHLDVTGSRITAGAGGAWLVDPDDLVIDAGLAEQIDGVLGGGTSVTLATTSGAASATNADISGGADVTTYLGAPAQGDIHVLSPVSWGNGGSLTLNAYNSLDIRASITTTGSGSVNLNANGPSGVGGSGAGAIVLASGASLGSTGGSVTLMAPTITVNGPVTANTITLTKTAGTGGINVAAALSATNGSLNLGAGTGAVITLNSGAALSGPYVAMDSVMLGADQTISSPGGPVFIGAVDGAHALTVTAPHVGLASAGATIPLTTLTLNSASISLTGTTYTATTGISATGSVDALIAGTTITAPSLTFAAIDGTNSGALALNAGSGSLSVGSIGAGTAPNTVAITAGTTTLNGTTYNAATSFTVGGSTVLTGDTTVTAPAVSLGAVDGAHVLTVTATGAVSLGSVGAVTSLSGLNLSGAALTLTGPTYRAVTFVDPAPVTLTSAAAITTTGAITLGAIDGAFGLTLNSGSANIAIGAVGATTPLASLSLTGAALALPGARTSGSQTYNGTLGLTQADAFSSTGAAGDLSFGAITGAQTLTLSAGRDILFNGDIGAETARLSSLNITRARNVEVATDPIMGTTYTLWVVNFTGSATGLMSFGDHSLEGSGGISITASEVDGRVVTGNTQTVAITTGALAATVTGGNVTISADTIQNSTVTAAQTATVSTTQGIGNTTIVAQNAQVSVGTVITGGSITAPTKTVVTGTNVQPVSAPITTTPTPPTTPSTPSAPVVTPTSPTQTPPATTAPSPLGGSLGAVLASVQTQSNGSDETDGQRDQDDTATPQAQTDSRNPVAAPRAGSGYDYANQYIRNVLDSR